MINLYPRINITANGMQHSLDCTPLSLPEYYGVYPLHGGEPIWFTRKGGDAFERVEKPSIWDTCSLHTMDPITAVLKGLVTPDEIRMPAGVAGLLALLTPV